MVASCTSLLACARAPAPEKPNIVLIVVDTLRADHLGSYGYERDTSPVIDAFARENVRFDYAVATAPWTAPSIASIFTGLYPTAHGVTRFTFKDDWQPGRATASVLSDDLDTLAEGLKRRGYQTVGVTANAWVADYLGFAQGFDSFRTLDHQPAHRVNAEAFTFLDAHGREDPPFFLYLHYMDPHEPYASPEPIGAFHGPLQSREYDDEELKRIAHYDAEIRYVDGQIGELFRAAAIAAALRGCGDRIGQRSRRAVPRARRARTRPPPL